MNWQQNAELQRPFGAPSHHEENNAGANDVTAEDSSILRYIKTLTNRQTSAKQQRMDRYLKQVKHTQPADNHIVRPSQYPANPRQDRPKATKKTAPYEKHKLPGGSSVVQSGNRYQGNVANAGKNSERRSKRPYEAKQGNRQQKKPKRAPNNQQNAGIGLLDRFILHGTWSQDKTQTVAKEEYAVVTEASQNAASLTPRNRSQLEGSACQTLQPQTDDTEACEVGATPSVQTLLPLAAFAACSAPAEVAVTAQGPRGNSIHRNSFMSPEENQSGNVAACAVPEPLSSILDSIHF